MIRILLVGLWICAVAFGSLFLSSRTAEPDSQSEPASIFQGLEYVKTDVITVPVFAQGNVAGYIVIQLVYTIDSTVHRKLKVPLELYISDELFRKLYSTYSASGPVEKIKFEDMREQFIKDFNARFPEPVIKDLLVEQFNYISSDEVRTMNTRKR